MTSHEQYEFRNTCEHAYLYLQIPAPQHYSCNEESAQEEPTAPEERRVIIIDI